MSRFPDMARVFECAQATEILQREQTEKELDEARQQASPSRFPNVGQEPGSRPMSEAYGIPAAEIAALCGVDIATARRWKAGTSRIPVAAKKLLAGDLGAFGPHWKGWTIRDGKLVSPEGWDYSPGEVLSLTFLRSQVAHLEAQRRIENRLDEQPSPHSITTREAAVA